MKTFKQFLQEKNDATIGIHYSHQPHLNTLVGGMSGTGIKGAEQERLSQSSDARIKKRIYFYPDQGSNLPRPETGLGTHVYSAKLTNMLDASKNSPELLSVTKKAKEYTDKGVHPSNAFESSVVDHGYSGYKTDLMHVVLNKDVPVTYKGTSEGHSFVSPKTNKTESHSIFDVNPNSQGYHESGLANSNQIMFYVKNHKNIQKHVPTFKMEYGRFSVHKNDIGNLKKEMENYPEHQI